jgi:tetratricopeptide (TPR) repeat protein
LGDALTEAGQPARAAAVLDRAIGIAPTDPLLWYQLGIVHSRAEREPRSDRRLRKPEAAIRTAPRREFLRALEINPDLPEALGNLGHYWPRAAKTGRPFSTLPDPSCSDQTTQMCALTMP